MITKIEVENIGGIGQLKIEPGIVTVIRARNEAGKTSLFDALNAPFEKGWDPSLLKDGAESGFVRMVVDDGSEISFKQDERGNETKYVPAGATKSIKSARTFVQGLRDAVAMNPVKFDAMDKKEQMEYLLTNSPVEFTVEDLALVGEKVNGPLKLTGIEALYDTIYEKRTKVNVTAEQAAKTIKSLRATVGEDDGTDWGEVWNSKTQELDKKRNSHARNIGEIRNDYAQRILRQREIAAEKIRLAEAERDNIIGMLRLEAQKAEDSAGFEVEAELQTLMDESTTAREKAAQQQRNTGAKKQIAEFEQTAKDSEVKSAEYSKQLTAIEKLKKSKLKTIGVEGMEFRKGEIHVDGLPWRKINKARRLRLAFQLCSQGNKGLPLILIDDAECMVGETWKEFLEIAKECGQQVIAWRAEDCEFSVEVAA